MGAIYAADRVLFAGYERFAHAVQRLTGRVSYSLARMCAVWCILRCALGAADRYVEWLDPEPSSMMQTVLFTVATYVWVALADDAARRTAAFFNNPKSAQPPKEMSGTSIFRPVIFAGIAFAVIGNLVNIFQGYAMSIPVGFGNVGIVSYYYLYDVTPLPPGTSKVRAWLRALVASLRPAQGTV